MKQITKNLVSAGITPVDKVTTQTAIQTINGKLPFLIALTNEERRGSFKLGDKTLPFVEKTLEYAKDNPSLVPNFVDLPEANKDFLLSKDLTDILQWLKPLVQKIEDTAMESGVEALSSALVIYKSIKNAMEHDVLNAKTIYTDLSKRFPGRSKKITPPVPPIG